MKSKRYTSPLTCVAVCRYASPLCSSAQKAAGYGGIVGGTQQKPVEADAPARRYF